MILLLNRAAGLLLAVVDELEQHATMADTKIDR